MPEFREYQEVEVEVEITPSDFIDRCDKYEIEELIWELVNRGFINKHSVRSVEKGTSIQEDEFNAAIDNISRNRLQLTQEEDIIIQKISNRLY